MVDGVFPTQMKLTWMVVLNATTEEDAVRRKPEAPTRLEQVMRAWGVNPSLLALASGHSRPSLRNIRYRGNNSRKLGPTEATIRAITAAMRRLTGQDMKAGHLFELGDGMPAYPAPEGAEER